MVFDGLLITLVNQVVQTLLIDSLFANHALQHGARSVSAPETRDGIFLCQLMISPLRGFLNFVPVQLNIQDGLALGRSLNSDLHTFLQQCVGVIANNPGTGYLLLVKLYHLSDSAWPNNTAFRGVRAAYTTPA